MFFRKILANNFIKILPKLFWFILPNFFTIIKTISSNIFLTCLVIFCQSFSHIFVYILLKMLVKSLSKIYNPKSQT